MNTRHIVTTKAWFGGGADLTPMVAHEPDTRDFHAALKAAVELLFGLFAFAACFPVKEHGHILPHHAKVDDDDDFLLAH